MKIYQMQGFKSLIRSNPNMSSFLGVVRQDMLKDGNNEEMSAQVTGRSMNLMDFNRMIEKLKVANARKQEEKDQWNQKP